MQEAGEAFLDEQFLTAPDGGLRLDGLAHDLVGANTVGAREDDRRPQARLARRYGPGDRTSGRVHRVIDDGNTGAHRQIARATETSIRYQTIL